MTSNPVCFLLSCPVITQINTLFCCQGIRKKNKKISIVLMGYISNIFMYPMNKFVEDVAKADIDGVLVIDAPHETREENKLRELLGKHNICLIKLIAPTTDEKRIKEIVKISRGFIYAVNVKGITGVKRAELASVKNMMKFKQARVQVS